MTGTLLSLRSIASALGGEVVSREVLAPGPGHSRKDRSLAVLPSSTAPGGFVVRSYSGDDWRLCRDYVARRLGIDVRSPLWASPTDRMQAREIWRRAAVGQVAEQAERTARALELWNAAGDPCGTPVETYLQSRGVALPYEAAGSAIRFHPACPFAGQRTPAMVCLVRDMVTDEPKALHRTALDESGRAVEINGHKRLSLGPIGGCAIKITPHAVVRDDLGIGEGLESTLSLREVPEFGDGGLWSLLSAGNLNKLPLVEGVRKLWIATDHDKAGLDASRAVASKWRRAGRQAFLVIPTTPKLDLNDLVMGGRLG